MRGSIWGVLALVAVAGWALPVSGQNVEPNGPGSQIKSTVRSASQPYTMKYRVKLAGVRSDGIITGKAEQDMVYSEDSQGRQLVAITSLEKGRTVYRLDDHLAGTRTVWSTDKSEANVLKFPVGVPGRNSCWKIASGGLDFGLLRTTCFPSDEHYCDQFGAVSVAQAAVWRSGSSVAKASYGDCKNRLSGARQILGKEEDLGTETILGFETHGCRITRKAAAGITVDEKWVVEFGLETSWQPLVMRSFYESPILAPETVTTTRNEEMTSLALDEPAPATLQPPEDYEIKTVEMYEVPCEN
jgi:hypothetical protein